MGHLDSSDIIGIAVGVPSAVIAFLSLIIGFCSWKRPQSSAGQLGNAIARKFPIIRGGRARGGDAHGCNVRAADAHAGKIEIEGDPGERDIEAGEARGGDAYGTDVRAGDAHGGDISIKFT